MSEYAYIPEWPEQPEDLHICGGCAEEAINIAECHPVNYETTADGVMGEVATADISLQCINCGWACTHLNISIDPIEELDERLDEGDIELRSSLSRVALENMELELEYYSAAIARNLRVTAADFIS